MWAHLSLPWPNGQMMNLSISSSAVRCRLRLLYRFITFPTPMAETFVNAAASARAEWACYFSWWVVSSSAWDLVQKLYTTAAWWWQTFCCAPSLCWPFIPESNFSLTAADIWGVERRKIVSPCAEINFIFSMMWAMSAGWLSSSAGGRCRLIRSWTSTACSCSYSPSCSLLLNFLSHFYNTSYVHFTPACWIFFIQTNYIDRWGEI